LKPAVNFSKANQPIATLDDWERLARPKRRNHWKPGRSAMELAMACCPAGEAPDMPAEELAILASVDSLTGVVFDRAHPEHKVRFDNLRGEPRNADLVAIGQNAGERVALSVEAKADESFGELVSAILLKAAYKIAQDIPTNAIRRVQLLADGLLQSRCGADDHLGGLRYQLLTATAGALAFARQENAQVAVFLVHEFRSSSVSRRALAINERDLNQFVCRLSGGNYKGVELGELVGPIRVRGNEWIPSDIPLYIGKVCRHLNEAADGRNRVGL
jgi:hypothetical protein